MDKVYNHLKSKIKLSIFGMCFIPFLGMEAPISAQQPENHCAIVGEAIQSVHRIRGLSFNKQVPCRVKDKEQVRTYLLDTIAKKVPVGRLGGEELVYKLLGFIPEEYNYKQGLVDMYTQQLSGYYDPEAKEFIMAAWLPAIVQVSVAVHELTHALQDQQFDLNKFIDMEAHNSDLLLARSALVEGDATAVMIDYSRSLVGQPGIGRDGNVDNLMMQNIVGMSLLSGMRETPQSLKTILVFPYISGLRFVHALLVRDGYKEVDRTFKHPPRSTEDVLHPEKYFAFKKSDFVEIGTPKNPFGRCSSDAKVEFSDTLGEFAISTLISVFVEDKDVAATAAAGWGGDKVVLFRSPNPGCAHSLVWSTHWDTEQDADEFFQAYTSSLRRRYPSMAKARIVPKGQNNLKISSTRALKLEKIGQDVIIAWKQKS